MAKNQRNMYFNSKKLLNMRLKSKLTLKELGKELGLSDSTICVLESDLRNPSVRVLVQYCLYFGVNPFDIINKAYSCHMIQSYINELVENKVIQPEVGKRIMSYHDK